MWSLIVMRNILGCAILSAVERSELVRHVAVAERRLLVVIEVDVPNDFLGVPLPQTKAQQAIDAARAKLKIEIRIVLSNAHVGVWCGGARRTDEDERK